MSKQLQDAARDAANWLREWNVHGSGDEGSRMAEAELTAALAAEQQQHDELVEALRKICDRERCRAGTLPNDMANARALLARYDAAGGGK